MCHAVDSHPPDLPADLVRPRVAGGAAPHHVQLTSADGTVFQAAVAVAQESCGPAVVILPDVRGLYSFYVELADRFAAAGHHAIAIDYFGRSAGAAQRDADFEWMPHVTQTRPEEIQADIAVAIEHVKDQTGVTAFVTVGFCFGGTQSLLSATNPELDVDAVIAFYGGLDTGWLGIQSPRDRTQEMVRPVLGLYGGDDPNIPPEDVAQLRGGLEAAGVEHEIVVYEGAPHSFFDRSFDEHADVCADAWRRVLRYLER
jgi:carboxymethylenebutenolidase